MAVSVFFGCDSFGPSCPYFFFSKLRERRKRVEQESLSYCIFFRTLHALTLCGCKSFSQIRPSTKCTSHSSVTLILWLRLGLDQHFGLLISAYMQDRSWACYTLLCCVSQTGVHSLNYYDFLDIFRGSLEYLILIC